MLKSCLILILLLLAPLAMNANAVDLYKEALKTGTHVFENYEMPSAQKSKGKEASQAPEPRGPTVIGSEEHPETVEALPDKGEAVVEEVQSPK